MVKNLINRLLFNLNNHKNLTPVILLKSQWQDCTVASWNYFIYRWVMAAIFVLLLSFSLLGVGSYERSFADFKWLIYLTNWGFTLCTIQSLLGAFLVTDYFKKCQLNPDCFHGKAMTKSLKCYCILNTSSYSLACGISFIYWVAVYKPESNTLDPLNFFVHAFNSVLMLIDLMVVRYPIKLSHVLYPMGFVLVYLFFNAIYFLAGGTDRNGQTFIYEVLNWKNPGMTILFSVGGFVFLFFLHFIICCISVLRQQIYEYIKSKKSPKVNGGVVQVDDSVVYSNSFTIA